MIPGTTPTFTYILENPAQALYIANVRVDLTQDKSGAVVQKYKSKGEVTVNEAEGKIATTLTQEESLQFERGRGKIQIHVLYDDATAWKTYVQDFKIDESTTDDVIAR